MNIYSIALFLHIVGALGFFSAFALEWTGLRQVQHAALLDQARAGMRSVSGTRRLGEVSGLTMLVTGIYMTVIAWHGVAWTTVALISVVLLMALGALLTRPRLAALEQTLSGEKAALSQHYFAVANHPLLMISLKTRVAIALGIVFLMTVKPGLGGSLLTIILAAVIGLGFSLYMPARAREQKEIPN